MQFFIHTFYVSVRITLCSIWNFNKKVGLRLETQQNLLLECQWSWAKEKIQKSYDGLFKYFTFCKCAPLKMQKVVKQAGSSRQIFGPKSSAVAK